ncbi:MAG: TonB-dependent copper receptor [Neisseria sp.]|nr:TonB-dependent copper receptor [Neisseria sp.]
MKTQWKILPLLLAAVYAHAADTTENAAVNTLGDVVVTAVPAEKPEQIRLNPKAPVQPIPAADGAGLLKTVPNMSVIRKGGMSGDPLFRGLGGSRLSISASDTHFFGGCGGRMDPPTSYIFPEVYDEVIITKGPQTVTQGPGVVAGAVQFVRKPYYFLEAGINGNLSLTGGNFGRFDAFGEVTGGFRWGYAHFNAAHNQSDDYKDGNGHEVHSAYKRNSQNFALGLTPDENTVLEVAYDRSRGWAAYADRAMDGTKFDRDAWHVRAERKNITSWLAGLKLEYGHSYVDHVMDNYSHRPKSAPMFMVSNPDRETDTLRAEGQLELGDTVTKLGIDWMSDEHAFRNGGGMTAAMAERNYTSAPRVWDQKFRNIGIYAETTWQLDDKQRLVGGLRHDQTRAEYNRVAPIGQGKTVATVSPQDLEKTYRLTSGFARYEYRNQGWTYFAGLGVAQRAPDFWERMKGESWKLKAETNTELNAGVMYQGDKVSGSLTVFGGRVNDFILVDGMKARNINANRYGFEGDIAYAFAPNWKVGTALAYTYGQNKTDDRPLAQTPPLEAKTYIGYDNGTQSLTLLMRNVASQHRYATGQGNIIGMDTGSAPSFSIFSINGGWKFGKNMSLTAGVDNLFDKRYREFVNKSAANVAGYNPSNGLQIYEPGRQFWAKFQAKF